MTVDGKKVLIRGDMSLALSVLHLSANGKGMTTQIAGKRPGEVYFITIDKFELYIAPLISFACTSARNSLYFITVCNVHVFPVHAHLQGITIQDEGHASFGQQHA